MAVEVDNDELKALLDTSEAAVELQIFADLGIDVVTEQLGDKDSMSDDVKSRIAMFVAAHFYVLSRERGGLRTEMIGEARNDYRHVAADKVGWLSTRYGQMAVSLDSSGTLLAASHQWQRKAVFEHIKTQQDDIPGNEK